MTNLALPALEPTCDNDTLSREITLLAGQINAAHHRFLKLIAEFDRRKAWSGGGTVRSCAHWLNWKCGIVLSAAREKVRVAHAIEGLPLINAAFAKGEVSYSKVRAMTRAATAENEDYLLMIARHGTASHLEQVINRYRRVRRGLEREREKQQEANRKLVYYQNEAGMWVIHAELPPEVGDLVVKAIEAAVEQLRVPETLAEDVSAETSPEDSEVAEELLAKSERPTFPQHRADALERLAEHFLAYPHGTGSLAGQERCQLQLHVSIDALRGATGENDPARQHCHLEPDIGISPDTARRLGCDASVVTIVEDAEGRVLNIGRRSRTVPGRIRKALALRDRTCRVPGCCESRYVDAHHVVHWADGGETSLENLITLCRHHHRALHNGEFSMETVGSGARREFIFRDKQGRVVPASVHPQFGRVSAETSATALADAASGVNAATAVTRWCGERCDFDMAMDGLLRRDGLL